VRLTAAHSGLVLENKGMTLALHYRLAPALRALARELGVADAVRFLGYVSPIQRAIEESAIVVVPSMGEGFGMVALEAMERARPVIAAAIGGLGELVEDGETGILVEPGMAGPLARAIVELAGDLGRAARMGKAGRRRALAEFLERRCTDHTEQLYRQALDKAKYEQELKVAAEIQRALLPAGLVDKPFCTALGSSAPCLAVGGDFFDYVDLPAGQFGFIVGDVAGKGSPAALLAAAVLWMGLYPLPIAEVMHASVNELLRHVAAPKI